MDSGQDRMNENNYPQWTFGQAICFFKSFFVIFLHFANEFITKSHPLGRQTTVEKRPSSAFFLLKKTLLKQIACHLTTVRIIKESVKTWRGKSYGANH
jgi:hypothetical protein